MYFWKIEKLKTQLIEKPLAENEALPYLIITILAFSALRYSPQPSHYNVWDYLSILFELVFAIVGTYWLYNKNNGEAGSHFFQRYFAIGWVASLRFIAFLIPIMILISIIGIVAKFELTSETSNIFNVLILLVTEIVLYWYIGKHIAEVAEQAKY